MMIHLLLLLISGVMLPADSGWAQSTSSLPRLKTQLERAVAAEDWDRALEIVDQLMAAQPQSQEDLQVYRQRLEALAASAPVKVEISPPRAAVFSTRTERRQKQPDSTFIRDARDVAIVVVPGLGPVLATEYPIVVQLPDQYEVVVPFIGPVNRPEDIAATVTLVGGGEQSITRTFSVGGSVATTTETFVFSSRQVPTPNRVIVSVENGPQRTFSVGLPDRNTVLAETRTVQDH